jgi:hypothetical protein
MKSFAILQQSLLAGVVYTHSVCLYVVTSKFMYNFHHRYEPIRCMLYPKCIFHLGCKYSLYLKSTFESFCKYTTYSMVLWGFIMYVLLVKLTSTIDKIDEVVLEKSYLPISCMLVHGTD